MESLSKKAIIDGLRELGLESGDKVLVHSSLVALGKVEGGPDAVIDALLETVGPEGLVMVPTFACKAPFDRRTSSTGLGVIAETFWHRPEAIRSLHPTHSVAAIGKGAAELLADHEKASTAYGEDTPYCRLAGIDGKILLLGVDQDRNTTLHAAEAIAEGVYLKTVESTYIDDSGNPVTISVAGMAGPHRDFIGLDRLFRETGVMDMGRIGKAVCRLIDARYMLEVTLEALEEDPAACLCDNPACADCVMQRGLIKAALLNDEDFTLAAVAGDISDKPEEVLAAIAGQGIKHLELTSTEYPLYRPAIEDGKVIVSAIRSTSPDSASVELAAKLDVPLVVPVGNSEQMNAAISASNGSVQIVIENTGAKSQFYADAYAATPDAPHLAFSPARFAAVGQKPFLEVFYKGTIRKHTARFYIDDAKFDGTPTLPGRGNAEVKEIISILRTRGYDGVMVLRSHKKGIDPFAEAARAFWRLIDTM